MAHELGDIHIGKVLPQGEGNVLFIPKRDVTPFIQQITTVDNAIQTARQREQILRWHQVDTVGNNSLFQIPRGFRFFLISMFVSVSCESLVLKHAINITLNSSVNRDVLLGCSFVGTDSSSNSLSLPFPLLIGEGTIIQSSGRIEAGAETGTFLAEAGIFGWLEPINQ